MPRGRGRTPQIFLQAEPGRRHPAPYRDAFAEEVDEGEIRTRLAADQKERVAGGCLAKAHEIAIAPDFIGLHEPHRPAPCEIDLDPPVEQRRSRSRRGRVR
jgi:hypothetical protein